MKRTMDNQKKKILILGSTRHGKDTFAEFLREFGKYTFSSSSEFANELFVFEKLKDKYKYSTKTECFADRVNHREEWFNLICDYNAEDPTKLTREILEKNDCYVGMRNLREFQATKHLFTLIIWIDASGRVPELESTKSFNIDKTNAHIVVTNNGTTEELKEKAFALCKMFISS
jgi:hypothetical protein